jgi:hypothetical protein
MTATGSLERLSDSPIHHLLDDRAKLLRSGIRSSVRRSP